MSRAGLLVRGAIVLVLALGAFAYRVVTKAPPEPMKSAASHWKPTPESRLPANSNFWFEWSDAECQIDSRNGTYRRWNWGGEPWVAQIDITAAERDSIKRAILASGFFDWPGTLGTPHPLPIAPSVPDEAQLSAGAGAFSWTVARSDRFGRDDEPAENREAKMRMTELGQLIRSIADFKPEVRRLPKPSPTM